MLKKLLILNPQNIIKSTAKLMEITPSWNTCLTLKKQRPENGK